MRVRKRAPGASIPHVQQNVGKIAALVERAERAAGRWQKAVEVFTGGLGRPRTLVFIALFIAVWLVLNLWVLRTRPFDPPPFPLLQGVLSLSSLLLTAMVLVTQNRQGHLANQRAQLDLQVNLLSEQKITKVIELLEEMRRDHPALRDRADPVADAMSQAVDPESVVSELERTLSKTMDP